VDVGHVAQCPLDELERHAAATVGEVTQGGRLRAGVLDRLQDPPQHGGDHHGVRDALLYREVHPLGGVEGGQVHDASTRVERAEHGCDSGDVVRGDTDQLRLSGV